MKRLPTILIAVGVFSVVWLASADTVLRHDCFAVAAAKADDDLLFRISSVRKAQYIYTDAPRTVVLGPDSRILLERASELGSSVEASVSAQQDGIYGLCLELGQNTATLAVPNHPWALVARKEAPLHICGSVDPLYFRPPAGIESCSIFVHASVKGEAALIQITDPEGTVVLSREDDFDQTVALEVAVPEGMSEKVWTLEVLRPRKDGWVLDDVTLWFGRRLQPLLALQPEHLEAFAGVGARAPEQIRNRMTLREGRLRLGRDERKMVTFELIEAPTDAKIALRMLATDVDYRHESPVLVNGTEFLLPVTGDGLTAEVTVIVPSDTLRNGENTLEFRQDGSGGSGTYSVSRVELLSGTVIHAE